MEKFNITPSLEDYLETICLIQRQKGSARVTEVADYLGVSKPSVNKAINILKENELVNHERYGQLTLSQRGREEALKILKRHVLLTDFLHIYLGVGKEESEKEACLLEHALSHETAALLEKFLEDNFGYRAVVDNWEG